MVSKLEIGLLLTIFFMPIYVMLLNTYYQSIDVRRRVAVLEVIWIMAVALYAFWVILW